MSGNVLFFGGIVLFALLLGVGERWLRLRRQRRLYVRREALFTPAERAFLEVLEQAVGAQYRIYGKVRVADVVEVKRVADRLTWQGAFNRISAKHFDFLLCSREDTAPVCAVELDDRSHARASRRRRDAVLEEVCAAAGLPLVRAPARAGYAPAEVQGAIRAALEPGAAPAAAAAPASPARRIEPVIAPQSPPEEVGRENSRTAPHPLPNPVAEAGPGASPPMACPRCGAPMQRRRAVAGSNAGREFWGCSAFPACRTILPIGGTAAPARAPARSV